MDHGARHPDMPQHSEDAFILTCNVSMEYEKAFVINSYYPRRFHCPHNFSRGIYREVNSGFFYKTAVEREEMVKAERKFIDDRVDKVIALKKKVVGGLFHEPMIPRLHLLLLADSKKGFVVINQKGIDPVSLDKLAREGITALRRAKRRNMERFVNVHESKGDYSYL